MKNLTSMVIILVTLFFLSSQLVAGEHPKSEKDVAKKIEKVVAPKVEKAEHPKADVAKCQTPGCIDGSCDVCKAKKAKEEATKELSCKTEKMEVKSCKVSKEKKTEHPK